jgi:hypothetical protein
MAGGTFKGRPFRDSSILAEFGANALRVFQIDRIGIAPRFHQLLIDEDAS